MEIALIMLKSAGTEHKTGLKAFRMENILFTFRSAAFLSTYLHHDQRHASQHRTAVVQPSDDGGHVAYSLQSNDEIYVPRKCN